MLVWIEPDLHLRPERASTAMRLALLAVAAALAGCRSEVDGVRVPDRAAGTPPSTSAATARDSVGEVRVPRRTRPVFASDQYGLAVRVPEGLHYCAIPAEWVGSDHGRAFYIRPPASCDTAAGFVLGRVAEQVPTLELYYGYNVPEYDFGDGRGERVAESDWEVAREDCAQVERLPDVRLLGRAAVGCRGEGGGDVYVKVGALYEAEHAVGAEPLDAQLVVSLTTTRERLAADWPAFVAFAAGVAQCTPKWEVAQWDSARAAGAGRGGPRWLACPQEFW